MTCDILKFEVGPHRISMTANKTEHTWYDAIDSREMLGAPSNIAGAPNNFYEWTILPFNKKL